MLDLGDIKPGDRVLVRAAPLLGRMTIDHVRAGEPEPDGAVWCSSDALPLGYRARYKMRELVACPPGYEPPPPPGGEHEHWLLLRWLARNREALTALHGAETIALTERQVRQRFVARERIGTSLAAESDDAEVMQRIGSGIRAAQSIERDLRQCANEMQDSGATKDEPAQDTEANDAWPHVPAECLAHCRSRMAPDDYDMAVLLIELYATLVRRKQIETDHRAWQQSIDLAFNRPITADEVEGKGKIT